MLLDDNEEGTIYFDLDKLNCEGEIDGFRNESVHPKLVAKYKQFATANGKGIVLTPNGISFPYSLYQRFEEAKEQYAKLTVPTSKERLAESTFDLMRAGNKERQRKAHLKLNELCEPLVDELLAIISEQVEITRCETCRELNLNGVHHHQWD